MKPRQPGPRERMVLEYLDCGPQPAAMVGEAAWKGTKRGRSVANHGGGDYAAQMLLGRMRRQGWVRVCWGEGSSVWELTAAGRKLLST